MSKPKISKLKKQLLELIKAHVRRRDDYTCQWCGKEVKGSDCQVSHVIPVSHGNALAFDPMNMKVLCTHCHLNKWHKDPVAAGLWFENKFPERWLYLADHRQDIVRWREKDYLEMIEKARSL
jgi:5-methylcytosine-specific restriction endonuclease McrA